MVGSSGPRGPGNPPSVPIEGWERSHTLWAGAAARGAGRPPASCGGLRASKVFRRVPPFRARLTADAVIASTRREWRFQVGSSKKVWSLPLMGSLPAKKVKVLASLDKEDGDEALDVFVDLLEGLCPGLTDELTLDELQQVMVGWQEASGITAGESRPSSD